MCIAWRQDCRHLSKRFSVRLWNNGMALEMLSTHCRLRKCRAVFTTCSYVKKKIVVFFPCGASSCIVSRDLEKMGNTAYGWQHNLLKLWSSMWSNKIKVRWWSSCPDSDSYRRMDCSGYCNRAPLWKGLQWISQPAPQHKHHYLPTLWGECFVFRQ